MDVPMLVRQIIGASRRRAVLSVFQGVRSLTGPLLATPGGVLALRLGMEAPGRVASLWPGAGAVSVAGAGPGDSVRGEWVPGPPTPGGKVIYYLHGGGLVFGSPVSHRGLVRRIGRVSGRACFSLDYRLAPRHAFPAALDDAVGGYAWLLDHGVEAADIVVMGDSAGGLLALQLIGELWKLRLPTPAAVVLLSPVVDPTFEFARAWERAGADPLIRVADAIKLAGMVGVDGATDDPRLDVLDQIGPHWPPMLVHAGGREVLRGDAERLGAAARAAGASCEVRIWPGQTHVFQMGYPYLPVARTAIADIARFISGDGVPRALAQPCEQ